MHEQDKIEEARYFISMMRVTQADYKKTVFNLSAATTAARSALQYALKEAEARDKLNGRSWYDSATKADNTIKFFKDKRDLNIHEEPITSNKDVIVHVGEVPVATHHYWFPDWQGQEDVITLCERYLDAVSALVADGKSQAFLG